MYKRLNSLKNYPIITTGDVFWLDLQRHADANGLTTLHERLAHFHQAIVTDRPLTPHVGLRMVTVGYFFFTHEYHVTHR
jgi:hypothetical protein